MQAYNARSFCPLILYHDKPSKELSIDLNKKRKENRSAIDRHLEKTNEMLLHNAHFWIERPDKEAEVKVSPSTSTQSNISSSSSSSGDSIATVDTYQRQPAIYNRSHETSGSPTPLEKVAETSKRRRRGNLPKEVTEFLRKWLIQHKKHPYPAEKEKIELAQQTGLTVSQISNWFINARRRILQPILESENLCAQMMAYSEVNHDPTHRRRHDYFYQDYKSAAPYPVKEHFMAHKNSSMAMR